jgi:hypothetical protein
MPNQPLPPKPHSRRRALRDLLVLGLAPTGALLAAAAAPGPARAAAPERPRIEVWKTPTCGCCKSWIEHLQAHGFEVTAHDVAGPADMRRRFGMPDAFGSCHTARIGDYVIEGHVPAADIHRLLAAAPRAVGLAVPGMPVGSPGMEMGARRDPYDVLLVQPDGSAKVWRSVR